MAYRKLNRASGNRKALFRSLSSALILTGYPGRRNRYHEAV